MALITQIMKDTEQQSRVSGDINLIVLYNVDDIQIILDSMIAIWEWVFLPFPHFAFGVGRLGSAGYESVQSRAEDLTN